MDAAALAKALGAVILGYCAIDPVPENREKDSTAQHEVSVQDIVFVCTIWNETCADDVVKWLPKLYHTAKLSYFIWLPESYKLVLKSKVRSNVYLVKTLKLSSAYTASSSNSCREKDIDRCLWSAGYDVADVNRSLFLGRCFGAPYRSSYADTQRVFD